DSTSFFFQAEDGIRDFHVTGVQTCALPILGLMFDFEWTNRTLFNNAYVRASSYYPNSEFSATGKPEGAEWLLLSPHRDKLPARRSEERRVGQECGSRWAADD